LRKTISKKGDIEYNLNYISKNIIQYNSKNIRIDPLNLGGQEIEVYKDMPTHELKILNTPYLINRQMLKLNCTILQILFVFFEYICQNCYSKIIESCNQCNESKPFLNCKAMCLV